MKVTVPLLAAVVIASANAAPSRGTLQMRPTVLTPHGIGPVQRGTRKAPVVSALTTLFGPPTGAGINTACGSRYTEVVWNDLAVEFRAGTFTGYRYVRGGYPLTTPGSPRSVASPAIRPRLETARGIALGSRLSVLRVDYPRLRPVGVAQWVAGGITFVVRSRGAGALTSVAEIKLGTCGDF